MNAHTRLMQQEREIYCFVHNGYYPKPVEPKRVENPHADADAQIDLVVRMNSGSQLMPREFKSEPPAIAGEVARTL